MYFKIDEHIRRRARTPHEISMFNLMFFHLLLGAGTIVLVLTKAEIMQKVGNWGFVLPLVASLSVIAFIHLRSVRATDHEPWFVAVHWRLAMHRSRLLLIAYAVTGLIIAGGFLVASGMDKKTMQDIVVTIATRIGAVPTLLIVMVSFVLESGSIYQAGRGEVPDGMTKRFPPPADLKTLDQSEIR
jgi:hypothetical protein